jgi:hypothetical protein
METDLTNVENVVLQANRYEPIMAYSEAYGGERA